MKKEVIAKMSKLIIGLSNSTALARAIANKLKVPFSTLKVSHFPDGEIYLRFTMPLKDAKVILVQTMHPRPSEALLELVFAAKTARELGAKKIIGVIPYLAYMRQDTSFKKGECVSARQMAWLLSNTLDHLITIDPHLHRVRNLGEIFTIPTKTLSVNNLLADFIGTRFRKEIIIGPDVESYQWASMIAKRLRMHAFVLRKKRYAARKVKIKIKESIPIKGKPVIIIDDIISSGTTMIETIKEVKRLGAKSILCIAVHGILAEGALEKLKRAGAEVITTNTITNPVGKIDVSGLIAEELEKI
ncbi:MAG: ribose-phosphate diphosphokinase [Candidatus Woesearchaeota archaeon]